MQQIRTAIIGVGNCASALVQGRYYYAGAPSGVPGLITHTFGGYTIDNVSFVAAFDVDERKVGLDLSKAIFAPPNCTRIFREDIPHLDCPVEQGYVIDSVAHHHQDYCEENSYRSIRNTFRSEDQARDHIVAILKKSQADVLINYLPVGSRKNSYFYADCALEAGCAFINAIPVFISRNYGDKFREVGLPILGDDIKSQVGATIIHRVLAKLFEDRGQPIRHTYQLNVGGNTDFLTMLDRGRLESKKQSKTESVTSQIDYIDDRDIHIGPSDYVPWLNDRKVCFLRIEAEQFGGVPMELELRLAVEDSPNSAGVMFDAIRAARVAMDRRMAGPIRDVCAYLFKSPVEQFDDALARDLMKRFAR